MMNVKRMSDQEKSNVLMELCGWGELGENHIANLPVLNLYSPANMAMAWRVLNWALSDSGFGGHDSTKDYPLYKLWEWGKSSPLNLPPEKAQAAWLDKILELAIEAGMVDDE